MSCGDSYFMMTDGKNSRKRRFGTRRTEVVAVMEKDAMDKAKERQKLEPMESPYDTASFFSFLMFTWPAGLVRLGATRVLEQEDLPNVSKLDNVVTLAKLVKTSWLSEVERRGAGASLTRVLFASFWQRQWYVGLIYMAESGFRIYQAQVLGRLIDSILTDDAPGSLYENSYFLSFILVLCGAIIAFLHHHGFFMSWRLGMQLRTSLSSIIYDKAVLLSLSSISQLGIGHIVNLSAADIDSFQQMGCFIHFAYVPIIEAFAVLYFGLEALGPAFLAGFACIFLLIPLQTVFSTQITKSRRVTSVNTDQRLKVINQALAGVRLLKISAWEDIFIASIDSARAKEVAALLVTNVMRGLNEAIFFAAPCTIAALSFITYNRLGGVLTTGKIFVVLTYFNIVQFSMTKFFPMSTSSLSECRVAIGRIERLLLSSDVTASMQSGEPLAADVAVVFDNYSASWSSADAPSPAERDCEEQGVEMQSLTKRETLSCIDLTIKKGELVVVVGPVGSGKSSLLLAALNELPSALHGSVRVATGESGEARSTAYCAQSAFIISATVRDNIVFSNPFDQTRYAKVIADCALDSDIASFSHGDMTVVGDKGINLSGGQKARIGLARALYSEKDVYLLDDPLSAVDTHVGKHLFEQAICAALRGKTVVLATHQIQYLESPRVDRVVVVAEGRIVASGKFSDLRGDERLQRYFSEQQQEEEAERVDEAVEGRPSSASASSATELRRRARTLSSSSARDDKSAEEGSAKADKEEVAGILVAEDRASGSVTAATYMEYGKHLGGPLVCVGLVLIMSSAQVFSILANYWLSHWSRQSAEEQMQMSYLTTYIGFVVATVVCSITRSVVVFSACIAASGKLHNVLLRSVVNTKILFYDSNPLGRVLNRFAKDVSACDDLLPATLYDFTQCFLMCIGAILVVCGAVPYIFLSLIPIVYYFLSLRSYYLKTSREVKRLESLSRSPIFSHLTESLDGMVTIRAFDRVGDFQNQSKLLLNSNVRGYFAFVSIGRWLGFFLDVAVVVLLVAATYGSVLAKENGVGGVDNTAIAVGIMYIIQLTGLFQWMVRQSAECESLMVAVERILQFSRLEPEGSWHEEGTMLAAEAAGQWPQSGAIECTGLVASYRDDLPAVLKDVSFRITGGSRVGIVGRSGCGKSTLVSTLLRLVDIKQGTVTIDGVDILSVGLHDLRPRLSVIQQNPFLFSGTLRDNLDPWKRHSDAEIWTALDCVCLKAFVEQVGLEHSTDEGGLNFSTGERQLLCLARAILQRNKILIMDEATANIDSETDQRVQEAIKSQFRGCTILSVAHRLVTCIEYDIIIVMADGRLHEIGAPHELLCKHLPPPDAGGKQEVDEARLPRASFASLVLQTGPDMSLKLRRMAQVAFNSSRESNSSSNVV